MPLLDRQGCILRLRKRVRLSDCFEARRAVLARQGLGRTFQNLKKINIILKISCQTSIDAVNGPFLVQNLVDDLSSILDRLPRALSQVNFALKALERLESLWG